MTASVPPEVPSRPLRVLFVCTANVGRSPYAERRARAMLADAPVTVASAGVPGRRGWSMDADMAAQLARHGVAADGHSSRAVTEDLLADADLVLTFEFGQRMKLLDRWPQHARKVVGFHQFVRGIQGLPKRAAEPWDVRSVLESAPADSMTLDVADPHGLGARAAAACAAEIDDALSVLVPFLAGSRTNPDGNSQPAVAAPTAPAASPDVDLPRDKSGTRGLRIGDLLLLVGALASLGGLVAMVAAEPGAAGSPTRLPGMAAAILGVLVVVVGYRIRASGTGSADGGD